jgi:hypothetical protein
MAGTLDMVSESGSHYVPTGVQQKPIIEKQEIRVPTHLTVKQAEPPIN